MINPYEVLDLFMKSSMVKGFNCKWTLNEIFTILDQCPNTLNGPTVSRARLKEIFRNKANIIKCDFYYNFIAEIILNWQYY